LHNFLIAEGDEVDQSWLVDEDSHRKLPKIEYEEHNPNEAENVRDAVTHFLCKFLF